MEILGFSRLFLPGIAHPCPDDAQDHKLDDDGTGQQHEGGQDVGSLAEDGLRCAAEQVPAGPPWPGPMMITVFCW